MVRMEDVVGSRLVYHQGDKTYPIVAFPHPSAANKNWLLDHGGKLIDARILIKENLENKNPGG